MSEMIERVARALYFADCGPDAFKDQYERTGPDLSLRLRTFSLEEIAAYGDKNWPHYAGKARAAIEAMKDYTEEMSIAGGATPNTQFGGDGRVCGQSIAERAYLAMVSIALKE